jgi:NADH-quinone oxidoreductase subunit J
MSLADIVFLGLTAVTLFGAFLAVWLRNVFHNALGLILSLFGMAALFIYLDAEFLAVIQVIIYIGAISIAIIFAIMLSRPWSQKQAPRDTAKVSRALLAAALLFTGLLGLLRKTAWPSVESGDTSIRGIGRALLTVYALPFEAVSLVLLVAIIGALVISSWKEPS